MRTVVLIAGLLGLVTPQGERPLTLELRVFDGAREVTVETHLTVNRAGERSDPVARVAPQEALVEIPVTPGLYDVQAIQERDGRVVNIRWVERLVVMPYPDEGGHHLEIINFKSTFGALQVRPPAGTLLPEVTIFPAGSHAKQAAGRLGGTLYALFVVPAGPYDLQVRAQNRTTWYADIEVPLDRTRLWLVPAGER